MIFGLKIIYSLLLIGAFFTTFPIVAFFLLGINYFMDEYMRMAMLSFLCLGASMGISFTMIFHEKFTKSVIQNETFLRDKKDVC